MQDRLRKARQAAAELAERAQRLRPGASSDDDTTHDDEHDEEIDEELPPVEVSGEAHEELARLDQEDAAPITIDEKESFFDLLRKVDPTPPLPLTEVHEVGLVSLLRRLGEYADAGFAEDKRVRRVLDLVGDRLSISVGPKGITVRSLLRRKHTPWKRVQGVTVEGRYDLLRSDYVAKLMEYIKSNVLPFPLPGLGWLLRRVTNGIATWLEQRVMTDEQIGVARESAGDALLGIKRWGRDIELEGPLLMVSILAPGLGEAVEYEARARGIEVEVVVSGK